MSSGKWQVLWSPNQHDKFITFSNEVCLYKVVKSQETPPPKSTGARGQAIRLSDDTFASLMSVMTEIQYLKCLAWYPKAEPEDLLAVGQSNGRVVVTSIDSENRESNIGITREFVPRHSRQCNALAWNPVECNLLAAGLDKVRNDVSLLVWDINIQLSVTDSPWNQDKSRHSTLPGSKLPQSVSGHAADPSNTGNRPLVELSTSEPTVSLAWFPHESKTLIAGQTQKFLRIFDLRDTSRPHNAALTKAIYGVSVNPHLEHIVASFSEGPPGVVCIWDVRHFEKPMMTMTQLNTAVRSIAWSPTRSDLLATLGKDSSVVQLYDIQHASKVHGETEPCILDRSIKPSGLPISSISWHPTQENRMLSVSPSGTISDFTLFERISVSWSPGSHLTWGCGRHHLECSQEAVPTVLDEDISVKMKKRAMAGYGIEPLPLEEIALITELDKKLIKLWTWINQVKRLKEQGKLKNLKYQGVKTVISGESSSGAVCTRGKAESYQEQRLVSTVYYSEERTLVPRDQTQPGSFSRERKEPGNEDACTLWLLKIALALCGWDFDVPGSLPDFLKQALEKRKRCSKVDICRKLERQGEYERAAAVALFNNKIRRAIEILSSGHKQASGQDMDARSITLNMVAMALSGYTEERRTLWREMCSSLCSKLENPYLRSSFAFLTSDSFQSILNETDMEIEDRVAFACKYLPDKKLSLYIDDLVSKLIEAGDLNGILLTGVTAAGVDLLEKYVNRTTDVQTASLVFVNTASSIPKEVAEDVRVVSWIENYRNLLDMWRMWHQRARFDIHRNEKDATQKPLQQVYVTCNFCGNSIFTNAVSSGQRRRFAQYGNPSNRTKIMSCPGCRKPLPRCSLCLIHMGTSSTMSQKPRSPAKNAEKETSSRNVNPFSNWFTWCQTCRHGGHANHIAEWFREHAECPVTGCGCHCMNIDSVALATSKDESTEISS